MKIKTYLIKEVVTKEKHKMLLIINKKAKLVLHYIHVFTHSHIINVILKINTKKNR